MQKSPTTLTRSTPDVAQLGNTWISEFHALRALAPLDSRLGPPTGPDPGSYFDGIWDTNVIDGVTYGIPWYVDTRVLFYRRDILATAGYDVMPATWDEWLRAMEAVKAEPIIFGKNEARLTTIAVIINIPLPLIPINSCK